MGNRNPVLAVALCMSLTVHLLGLSALAWWYVAHTPPPRLASIDREKVMIDSMSRPKLSAPPPPPPARKKKPPLPKFQLDKPRDLPKDDSGETNGKGTANRSTPGDRPMEAGVGYEQADLMRDLPLQVDPDSPLPAAAGALTGGNANTQAFAQVGRYTPDFVADSKALADPDSDVSKPIVSHKGVGPLPLTSQDKDNIPVPSGAPKDVETVSAKARQTEVPRAIKGHRAVSSDAESIAFAKANSISFHNGKMDGRQGLKVSPKIPRFGLASIHDMEVLGGFRLVIGAWVDADGNVSDTSILQSSGSANVDLDYQNSVYNWTFEPPKDKQGHPTATMWAITCE